MLPLPSHVAATQEFPCPTIIKELLAFLGMVNFYRRFLPSIACTLRPLPDETLLCFGFAETRSTFKDVYEVSVIDWWGVKHLLEVVAVPWNLRTRFLQTYMPLTEELHQTGEDTDICIGVDH